MVSHPSQIIKCADSKDPEKETDVYRNAYHPNQLISNFIDVKASTCWDLFCKGMSVNGKKRPFIGTRQLLGQQEFGSYLWHSYAEVGELASRFALSISRFNLCQEILYGCEKYRFLGMYCKNRLEWFVAEQTANLTGITLVPLYDTLGSEALQYILSNTRLDTVIVSGESLPAFLKHAMCLSSNDAFRSNVKTIVLLPPYPCLNSSYHLVVPSQIIMQSDNSSDNHYDDDSTHTSTTTTTTTTTENDEPHNLFWHNVPKCPECGKHGRLWTQCDSLTLIEEISSKMKSTGIRLLHWSSCIELPKAHHTDIGLLGESLFTKNWRYHFEKKFDPNSIKSIATPDTIQTICYTSGTTGLPKGVMMTHANVIAVVAAARRGPFAHLGIVITEDDTHLSYLPLAHVFERVVVNLAIVVGASIGIFSGDVQRLLADMAELKPTVFVSVPRLFNKINDKINEQMRKKTTLAQLMFQFGCQAKLKNMRKNAEHLNHRIWDVMIFNKIKKLFGGKIRYLLVGGAPLDPQIQEKMSIYFCVPLLQGYGLTEAMGASFHTRPCDPCGYAGVPIPSIQFKIQSVPDLDYYVTADHPKGELLVQGPSVTSGYFQNPAETADLFDEGGWMKTGDIVEYNRILNLIRIIDRRKSLFKLAQGEYIAPEKLEGVYQQAELVEQIFVFGYSSKASLLAVVVPDQAATLNWCSTNGLNFKTFKEFCHYKEDKPLLSQDFKLTVLEQLEYQGRLANLNGFEILSDIFVTDVPFSIENGLLTPTLKLRRQQIYQKYKHEIDSLYYNLENYIKAKKI